eukprot:PITA_12540
MESSGKIEIEKFNGQSFELWKLKMEDILVDKYKWIGVDMGTKPTGVFDEEWKKLDRKAKSTIRLCVLDSVLLNVSREAMAKALWDKLGTLYQSKSLVNKLFLWKKLNLRMKDGGSVTQHLNASNTVVSQLASIDIKISDEDKCISLLCSLPNSWDSLVSATGSNATALHFDEILSSLLIEEMRWKNMESQNGDALSVWGKARIIGHGKVKLKLQGGRVRTLPGNLHIPALARNLLSVIELDDAGVKIVFEKDTCKMVRGALVLMWGIWIRTLYEVQGSIIIDGCNSSVVPESGAENLVVSGEKTMLWHQRLGHIGEKGLWILLGKGMVEGMINSSLDIDFCEGKKNRVSFPSGNKRAKQILELVHSDVFGTLKVPSLEFKALVENQTEKKIKVLRTENGVEFCSKEFEEFCKQCGIAWQKTTPYTPQ